MKRWTVILLLLLFVFVTSGVSSALVGITYIRAYDNVEKRVYYMGSWRQMLTGLYDFTVDGTPYRNYCLDPHALITPGDFWDAHYYRPGDVAAGLAKLFDYTTDPLALKRYRMMNYLYTAYGGTLGKDDRANLHLAFWEIAEDYDGTLPSLDLGSGNFQTSSSYGMAAAWLAEAQPYENCYDLPHLYTPEPHSAGQEIFAPIPEPGTLLLLGSGLLGVGAMGVARRRRK